MKKMNKYLAVAVGMVLAGAVQADITTLNLDFQPSGVPGGTYSVDYSGVGAAADSGTTWNIVAPSPNGGGFTNAIEGGGWFDGGYTQGGLVNSDGSAAGASFYTLDGDIFAFNPADGTYADFADDAKGLMGDYLQIFNDGSWSRSVFVDGLTVGQEYELYLYGSGPWARNTHFAVRVDDDMAKDYGAAQWIGDGTTTGGGGSHNLTEGVDYLKFTFTTASAMDTLWVEYAGSLPDDGAAFNGLQLAAIPEPASIGLIGVAGTLFLVIRRRLAM
jgi:hypothetical protein